MIVYGSLEEQVDADIIHIRRKNALRQTGVTERPNFRLTDCLNEQYRTSTAC